MRISRRAVLGVVLVALPLLTACTSNVNGRVVSASTGAPVHGAVVSMSGAATSTAPDGTFALQGVKHGQVKGVVRVSGYPDSHFAVGASGSAVVKIADSTLSLTLVENAVEPKPVRDQRVQVDGVEATGTAGLGPLAPGQHVLRIVAPAHEDYQATITLTPGSNDVTASLSLTPLETYRRFFSAGQFHRSAISYQYIHPDERKILTLKQWQEWGAGAEDKSIKFGDVRTLPSWVSSYVKKRYAAVVEIDRTIEYQVTDSKYSDYGQTYTDNHSQHWVTLDGKWFLVHDTGPK